MADTQIPSSPFGDMTPDEFRRHAHTLVEWAAGYFEQIETHAVLSQVKPGDVQSALPDNAPETPEPFERIIADLDRIILPAATHWNHPGFFARRSRSRDPRRVC